MAPVSPATNKAPFLNEGKGFGPCRYPAVAHNITAFENSHKLSGHGHLIGASNEVHRFALRRQMPDNVVPMSQGNGFPHMGCTQCQHYPAAAC